MIGRDDRRKVRSDLDRVFDLLVDTSQFDLVGRRWLPRWRCRRRLFAPVAPASEATMPFVEFEATAVGGRQAGTAISEARTVLVDETATNLQRAVPALIGGRPFTARRSLTLDGITVPPLERTLQMTEADRALLALGQLRQLFGFGTENIRATDPPHLSVVLSTNRVDLLPAALERIRDQRHVTIDLYVGVHGVSGSTVDPAGAIGGAIRTCELIEFPAEMLFGDVLADLSRRVTTDHVAKWDDDDLYGPNHLLDLWLFASLSGAPLTGKAAEFVLIERDDLIVRRRGGQPYRQSRFLAGGALLMSTAALRGIGNWGSLQRSVDQDIIERFDRNALTTFRIHGYEFVLVRHGRGHTWAADDSYFTEAAESGWSAAALFRAGLGERPPVEVTGAGLETTAILVPDQGNQAAVERFATTRRDLSPRPALVICDDRSDPPLAAPSDDAGVTVLRLDDGHGFGAGRSRHAAAGASDADVLVFADADMFITAEAYERTLSSFRAGFRGAVHADISFGDVEAEAAARILACGGSDQLETALAEARLTGQVWRERHWAASADLTEPRSTSFRAAVGAYLAIDRESYERTGGFRDVGVRGVEDTEFGYRLLAAGCEQRVLRAAGVWHLGDRTFSGDMSPEIAHERESYLNAYIPIWARSFAERAESLQHWAGPVVPAVGLPAEWRVDLDDELGRGATANRTASTSMLDAPFCVALELEHDAGTSRVIEAAVRTLRNGASGEVVVARSGDVVGRFVATWAANLARNRLGAPWLLPSESDWMTGSVIERLRADSGIAFVEVGG